MDKPRPPVKHTARFIASAFEAGLSPAHTRELDEYVQSHQSEGDFYAEVEGRICLTLPWRTMRVLYIVSPVPVEITLVGLMNDREPPSPPSKGKFLGSLTRSLLVHLLIEGGKRIGDIWNESRYIALMEEHCWRLDDEFFIQQRRDLASPRSRIIFQYEERSDAIGGFSDEVREVDRVFAGFASEPVIRTIHMGCMTRADAGSPRARWQF